MNKIDIIARRILGWSLNSWDKWYDCEKGIFIPDSEFQPDQNLDHAMIIVEKLQSFGFTFTKNEGLDGNKQVCFNDACAIGPTLAAAITEAAFSIADNSGVPSEWL